MKVIPVINYGAGIFVGGWLLQNNLRLYFKFYNRISLIVSGAMSEARWSF